MRKQANKGFQMNDGEGLIWRFLEYWKQEDYNSMYECSGSAWRARHSAQDLKCLFGVYTPTEFTVAQVKPEQDRFSAEGVKRLKQYWVGLTFKNVRKEVYAIAHLLRNQRGEWGVQPVSLLGIYPQLRSY